MSIMASMSNRMFLSIDNSDPKNSDINHDSRIKSFKKLIEYIDRDPSEYFGKVSFYNDSENVLIEFSTPYMTRKEKAEYKDIYNIKFTAVLGHSKGFVNELKAFLHCLEVQEFENEL